MWPELAKELANRLAAIAGVEVEAKDVGVAVHIRPPDPRIVAAIRTEIDELRRTIGFRVRWSDASVDLFPDVEWRNVAGLPWVLDEWVRARQGDPIVIHLTKDEGDVRGDECHPSSAYAVQVGRPGWEHAAACWVIDQTAAVDLLARIAFAWSAGVTTR